MSSQKPNIERIMQVLQKGAWEEWWNPLWILNIEYCTLWIIVLFSHLPFRGPGALLTNSSKAVRAPLHPARLKHLLDTHAATSTSPPEDYSVHTDGVLLPPSIHRHQLSLFNFTSRAVETVQSITSGNLISIAHKLSSQRTTWKATSWTGRWTKSSQIDRYTKHHSRSRENCWLIFMSFP